MSDDELQLGDLGIVSPEKPLPRARAATDFTPEAIAARKAEAAARPPEPRTRRMPRREAKPAAEGSPSEDAMALLFVERHHEYLYIPPWHRWMKWDDERWQEDSTALMYENIRRLVRKEVEGGKAERSTANAAFISGVERLLRTDQRIVALPEELDADPWALNTPSGMVDLRSGVIKPHDPRFLCTRITNGAVDPDHGRDLWQQFLHDITQGDAGMQQYLQRVAGYFATGVISEDVLVYIFGIGANAKSSFAEAVAHALGDYARIFAAEVLMEAKGERHPTELAQFMGVRFALTSEPASNAAWNDSRIKALTGDATISARFMRGDTFTFPRTHKTMVLGNHMPRLQDVTHAIRRRVQVVPFRAVFEPTPPPCMRERLKTEATGAIIAWVVEGARMWLQSGTAPPKVVSDTTADYLSDQDMVGQWLQERCERVSASFERSSDLHRDYSTWCERIGEPPKSNRKLAEHLISCGFKRDRTMVGMVFRGLRLRST